MTKILTRFYLEDAAWAKLQYLAALVHKPPKDVAEFLMLRAFHDYTLEELKVWVNTLTEESPPKLKGKKK